MFYYILLIVFIAKLEASCPEGSIEWPKNQNGSCYSFNSNSSGFSAAELLCAEKGGHLVSIHDAFINSLLAQEGMNYFHDSTVTDFWIGLTNMMPGGNWTWMDGTSTDFEDWASGEPKSVSGDNCASISLTDGRWKSDDCFKGKPFVCKVDKIFFDPPPTQYPVYANCTSPFIYFEPTHSCYGLANWTSIMNWTQGEEYCLTVKGHLVSVHSFEEKQFMMSLVWIGNNNIWTGGYSNEGGNTWKWSDSSVWDYDPWQSTFPNSHSNACVGVGIGGLWDPIDEPCSNQMRYVCKIKL